MRLLDVQPHHVVADVAAWGGEVTKELAKTVTDPQRLYAIDPNPGLLEGGPWTFIMRPPIATSLPTRSIDRLGCLVGLHHYKDARLPLSELVRVLRPGGVIAIAEVPAGGPVATFLDGPLDRFSSRGHRGAFPEVGALGHALERLGLVDVTERVYANEWEFASADQRAAYCRNLLAMDRVTDADVARAIDEIFAPITANLPWPLTYVRAVVPT